MKHGCIPWRGFVLVCDGAKALILRNDGDDELLNLRLVRTFCEAQPLSHDLGVDRPGRVHQAHGAARSSVEPADLHFQSEIAFLAEVADELDEAIRKDEVKALVVVAPPRTLGVLREHLPAAVRAIVTREVQKDLVKLPIDEIERHLEALSEAHR